jgi:hypothetical protein
MQVKYQLTIARLPLAKDLDDFQFEGAPTNAALVNDLAARPHRPATQRGLSGWRRDGSAHRA